MSDSDMTTVSVSRRTKKEIDKCAMRLWGLEAHKLSYNVILSQMANEINEGDN